LKASSPTRLRKCRQPIFAATSSPTTYYGRPHSAIPGAWMLPFCGRLPDYRVVAHMSQTRQTAELGSDTVLGALFGSIPNQCPISISICLNCNRAFVLINLRRLPLSIKGKDSLASGHRGRTFLLKVTRVTTFDIKPQHPAAFRPELGLTAAFWRRRPDSHAPLSVDALPLSKRASDAAPIQGNYHSPRPLRQRWPPANRIREMPDVARPS